MTDDQILELASEKFGIHYDRLDARFTDFARALESRVLAERKEPVIDKSMVKRLMVQHGLAHPTPDDASADVKRWKWASASTENADALMTFLIQHSGGNRDGFLVDVDSAIDAAIDRAMQDKESGRD